MIKFNQPFTKKNILIIIIPFVVLLWGLYTYYTSLPFYLKGCDPEYPYLINGLNCAILRFDRIGHFDHPGTPFQLFIGLVIRLTHLFFGKNSIVTDVFQRPEFYLGAVSVSITFIQAILLFIIGKIGIKKYNISSILILQLTPFYHEVFFDLNSRCNPDRFFIIISLLFIIVLLKYAFQDKKQQFQLAIWSGVLMGLGFATKFNYLPVLILPFFLLNNWKMRGTYVVSGIVSFTIFISPILKKFPEFRKFIVSIINHDGLYGSGNPQIFNIEKIINNVKEIFHLNPGLYFIIFSMLTFIIILHIRKNIKNKTSVLFLIGFFLLVLFQIIIVSKHFRNYYLTPMFSMYGVLFFVYFNILHVILTNKRTAAILSFILPILFLFLALNGSRKNKDLIITQKRFKQESVLFANSQLNKNNYWLVEPTWKSAPYIENALVYGLSYCGKRNEYEYELKKLNPNILTFNKGDKTLKSWKCSSVLTDTILSPEKGMYILSTPSRHANDLIHFIKSESKKLDLKLSLDTVFKQIETDTYIIELKVLQKEENLFEAE